MNFLYIGIAGFLGANLRVAIGEITFMLFPDVVFPYHTLMINLAGSFLFTYLFMKLKTKRLKIAASLHTAVFTGFLGSFTTFSTFSIETLNLFKDKQLVLAFLYISLSFLGGIAFAYAGMKIGQGKLVAKKIRLNYGESKR